MKKKLIKLLLIVLTISPLLGVESSKYYDEGEFKGFHWGKGYKPTQQPEIEFQDSFYVEDTAVKGTKKYNDVLGYHYEIPFDENLLTNSNMVMFEIVN